MSQFFKTIIRGFKNTSNSHLNPQKNFFNTFVNNLADQRGDEGQQTKPSKTYFETPLAGDMSCFNKTDQNSSENQKKMSSASVPFMVFFKEYFLISSFIL